DRAGAQPDVRSVGARAALRAHAPAHRPGRGRPAPDRARRALDPGLAWAAARGAPTARPRRDGATRARASRSPPVSQADPGLGPGERQPGRLALARPLR